MKRKIFLASMFLVSLVISSLPLFSDEGIDPAVQERVADPGARDWGGIGFGEDNEWRLRPGVSVTTAYDSNVFREGPHLRNDDVLFRYTPSIGLKREGTKFSLYSNYEASFQHYVDETEQNAFEHDIFTEGKYTGEKVKGILSDRWTRQTSYASSETSEFTTFVTNDISSEVSYRVTDKVSAAALFKNNLFRYLSDALRRFSYLEFEYGGRFYYHLTDKTDLYIHGSGDVVNYYEVDTFDSAGGKVLVGVRGELTDKVTAEVNTGYRGREYDRGAINSYHDWTYEGILSHKTTDKLTSTLSLKRDIAESTYGDMGYFELLENDLKFDYMLSELLKAQTGIGLQVNDYPIETTEFGRTRERRDYITSTMLRLIYGPVHNITVESGYAFKTRQSSHDNFDYMDHFIDLVLSYQFA